MNLEQLLNYQLTKDDFEITIDGVLVKFNSNIIKKFFRDQEIVQRLKKEQKKNQEFLDELIEEEKEGFVSEEYKEQLEDGKKFFEKILGVIQK